MATDDEVNEFLGMTWPLSDPKLIPWMRCRYCKNLLRVRGAWHPEGGNSAYVVLACETCKSTENGGRP